MCLQQELFSLIRLILFDVSNSYFFDILLNPALRKVGRPFSRFLPIFLPFALRKIAA